MTFMFLIAIVLNSS